MSPRARLAFVLACGMLGGVLWPVVAGLSTASGQTPPAVIKRAHAGSHAPSFTEPVFLLVLGGDARSGNPQRVRMDSIHIVSIDPKSRRASIMGIPRDSYVQIPGQGSGKINGAGSSGGPELMIDTVERLSGCRFDYYMLTSFEGFRKLVKDFGGFRFNVDRTLVDRQARANFTETGEQSFSGAEALAWARSRKQRPRGDFDRSLSHGDLMVAMLREARRDVRTDPGSALRNIAAITANVRTEIPVTEALKLGLLAMRISPGKVRNEVTDGTNDNVGGQSVVRITQSGLNQLADICADGLIGS